MHFLHDDWIIFIQCTGEDTTFYVNYKDPTTQLDHDGEPVSINN